MQDTTLLDQLTDDIGIAGQLLELSDQEFTALSERDLASLENILAKSSRCWPCSANTAPSAASG